MKKRIIVLGGDGFCGWPTALRFSKLGADVLIIDNFSRRKIDNELSLNSLTPIFEMDIRLSTWLKISGNSIQFRKIDLVNDVESLKVCLAEFKPDTIIHFAEQRSAPYSMLGFDQACYTVNNNITGTHNLLCAVAHLKLNTHIVHLGTMGVYGYDAISDKLPEGYLKVANNTQDDKFVLHPMDPGSIYHMTKALDQLLFQFYFKNYKLRISDLHQGIIWGGFTEETLLARELANRFDYDGEYGTVLNRFIVQAACGYPLTVYGSGGQKRAFINLRDSIKAFELVVKNAKNAFSKVEIYNQATEVHSVLSLAKMVSDSTGVKIQRVENPRIENENNSLDFEFKNLPSLGLIPTLLSNKGLMELIEFTIKYKDQINTDKIPSNGNWKI
jgi:UDP-sulfoquinovose synthase